MGQGLAAIVEYKRKQAEAQKAAEGGAVGGLKAAAPVQEKPESDAPPPKPVDYKPIKDKTPEEKKKLQDEMAAELAVRARFAAGKAKAAGKK